MPTLHEITGYVTPLAARRIRRRIAVVAPRALLVERQSRYVSAELCELLKLPRFKASNFGACGHQNRNARKFSLSVEFLGYIDDR